MGGGELVVLEIMHCLQIFKFANALKIGPFCPNAWDHNLQPGEDQEMLEE